MKLIGSGRLSRVSALVAVLPPTWQDDRDGARAWVDRSLDWARTLPAKRTKGP